MPRINTEIPGWMGEEELEWLYEQAAKYKSVVEVGSWMGRSTYALCSGCKGTVWAVDHFKGSPSELDECHAIAKTQDISEKFRENVGHFKNLKVLRLSSVIAATLFEDKEVEMVFLDGEHTYESVLSDLQAWIPNCSKLLCGHDINRKQVVAALEAMNLIWFTPPGTTLWYVNAD